MRDMNAKAMGDLMSRVRLRSLRTTANLQERPIVMTSHKLSSREIGMIRIYLKPREKAVGKGGWFGGGKPLYRELVMQAKAAGIMNAVAHHTHFGYSNSGKLQDEGFEIPNPDLTMCVELIADRGQLEEFCRTHGSILTNKVIIYKHIEHWDVLGHEIATDEALKQAAL
jgi:PII-like signaling protein